MRYWILFFIACPLWAQSEFSGSMGVLGRSVSSRTGHFESWDSPQSLGMGHLLLQGNRKMDQMSAEMALYGRYSSSHLYDTRVIRSNLDTPNPLVLREWGDLSRVKETRDSRSELAVYKAAFRYEGEQWRFDVGRMIENSGLGEMANPINPFTTPNSLMPISDVPEVVDGMKIRAELAAFSMSAMVLGNRNHDPTVWVQSEGKWKEGAMLLVFGNDDNETKVGVEGSTILRDSLLFLQWMHHEDWNEGMLGWDRQLSELWHARMEWVYEEDALGRFPEEKTLGLSVQYDIHPLVKLKPTLLIDTDSGFSYGIGKMIFSVTQNLESEFYLQSYLMDGNDMHARQRAIGREAGMHVQYFF